MAQAKFKIGDIVLHKNGTFFSESENYLLSND